MRKKRTLTDDIKSSSGEYRFCKETSDIIEKMLFDCAEKDSDIHIEPKNRAKKCGSWVAFVDEGHLKDTQKCNEALTDVQMNSDTIRQDESSAMACNTGKMQPPLVNQMQQNTDQWDLSMKNPAEITTEEEVEEDPEEYPEQVTEEESEEDPEEDPEQEPVEKTEEEN